MDERNVSTFASYAPGSIGSHTLFLLSFCLVGCIVVIVWLSHRARYGLWWYTLRTTLESTDVLADKKDRVTEFSDPFAAMESGQLLPPLTSGYLAAQAEMKRSTGTVREPNSQSVGEVPEASMLVRPSKPQTNRMPVDQQVPWRRHSYPSAQKQKDGLLHDTSTRDTTRYLPDEADSEILWRRRILVFEGKR